MASSFLVHTSPQELADYLDNQRADVVMNTEVNSATCSSILVDEHNAMSIVVQHLVNQNRRRLGLVGIRLETYAAWERWYDFMAAIKAAGFGPEPQYMVDKGWIGAYNATIGLL